MANIGIVYIRPNRILGINNSMLIDAGSAKGFSGFYALTGIFATPQLLASACIAFLIFSSDYTL